MESSINSSSVESESPEESKFAGVVFHNIQDLYIPGKDIRCYYSIKPWVSTTANDWIGLYKVGWQSPKDYLCYEYSPVIENSAEFCSSSSLAHSLSSQNSVVFREEKLPSEECEFYQFCYVTSSGEIRGASYPFQISYSKPGDLEICSEEDEDGLLVVNSRTTLLENSLSKACDENAALRASKEKIETECLKYQDMILILETKKAELVSLNEKQKKMLDKAIGEKTEFEELYKETFEQLKSSQTGLKIANEKTTEVQQQLENERAKHLKNSSEQQKFEEERVRLLDVISNKDATIQGFLETVEQNNSKISALGSEIQKLEAEKESLQESYDNLAEWKAKSDESLKKSEQAYAALEKSQAEQFEQVYKLQAENTTMNERLSAIQVDMEKMSDSFSHQKASLEEKHLNERVELENQFEMIVQQCEASKVELAATKEKLDIVVSESEEKEMVCLELSQRYEDSISKLEEQLAQERAFNNSLSSASDRQVAELQEQLNIQLEKNASVLKQIEEKNQVVQLLEESTKVNEKEIAKMRSEIQEQAQQLELFKKKENELCLQSDVANTTNDEKAASFEGSYFALKTAHEQLRKQYLQAKKDMENLWRQKADQKRELATLQTELPDSDLRFQMANFKKQIEDLRIRLTMGAEAYKAKFKECQKYEKQLKKIRKDSTGESTPQSPSSVAEFEIRNLKQSLDDEKTSSAALKKSLENYKMEACQAKEELSKIQKEKDVLQHEVAKLDKEARINNEERQKRMEEDRELQSYIECLHNQLEEKANAFTIIEEKYQSLMAQNDTENGPLSEEIEKLKDTLNTALEENKEFRAERHEMEQKFERQVEEIRELRGMVAISYDGTTQTSLSQDKVCEIGRGPSPSSNASNGPVHAGQQCPMCPIFFAPNHPESDVQQHVNSHFKD